MSMLTRLKTAVARHGKLGVAKMAIKRAPFILLGRRARRFRGAFGSYQEALASVVPGKLAGYDNEAAVEANFDEMCKISPWDAQVLVILERLVPQISCILDAGGHMGTKYRAFRERLDLEKRGIQWVIWDTPTAVSAGRKRAAVSPTVSPPE